jgi:hypothetical protein
MHTKASGDGHHSTRSTQDFEAKKKPGRVTGLNPPKEEDGGDDAGNAKGGRRERQRHKHYLILEFSGQRHKWTSILSS